MGLRRLPLVQDPSPSLIQFPLVQYGNNEVEFDPWSWDTCPEGVIRQEKVQHQSPTKEVKEPVIIQAFLDDLMTSMA